MSESTMPPEDVASEDAAVEALLSGSNDSGDPVTEVLDALRAEGRRFLPEPSSALAELLATGLAKDEFKPRRNRSRIVVGMLLAGGTTLGLSGAAAARDALPSPAQSVVTDIVNGLTPFHIAVEDRRRRPAPTDPAPHPRTTEPGDDGGRTAGPTPDRSGTDGGGADGGSGRGSGSGESGSSGSGRGPGSGKSASTGGSVGSGSGSGGDSGSGTSGSGGSGSGTSGSGGSGSGGSGSGGSGSGGSGSGGSGSGGDSGGGGSSGGSDGGSDGGGSG